jgi:biotin carboxyl carrier protein
MNLKRYNVTVNGTAYNVAVEEIEEDASGNPAHNQDRPTSENYAPANPPEPPKSTAPSGNIKIEAPMPGTIVEVKVKTGDSVKNGDAVAVLEAMKLENDIVSTADGIIASVNVAKGDSVSAGTVIVTLN